MHFDIDLAAHEIRRREAILAASDPDLVALLEAEETATALLYSGLDVEQTRILNSLRKAGVLP